MFNVGDIVYISYLPNVQLTIIKCDYDFHRYLCEEETKARTWFDETYLSGQKPTIKAKYNIGDMLVYNDEYYGSRHGFEVKVIDIKAFRGDYMYLCESTDEERKWYYEEELEEKEC